MDNASVIIILLYLPDMVVLHAEKWEVTLILEEKKL
jgi:hypothetical protein